MTREAAASDPIREAIGDALARAEASGQTRLLVHRVRLGEIDPLAAWAAAEGEPRFYWEQPAAGRSLMGAGTLVELTADGPTRFADVAADLRTWLGRLHVVGDAAPASAGPLFVGGFAFDDAHRAQGEWQGFPGGRLVLPDVLIARQRGEVFCSLACALVPGTDAAEAIAVLESKRAWVAGLEGLGWMDREAAEADSPAVASASAASGAPWPAGAEYRVLADRPHAIFREQVTGAVDEIHEAGLEKVVLARSLEVQHPGRFDVGGFLHRLRGIYPHCTILALGRGPETLVAASPELLVSLDDGDVEACALAGTERRGRTPQEDEALGRALLESKKNRAEHEAVVHALRGTLEAVCETLEVTPRPELMRIEGIQHLATPMRGHVPADALPAPAVLTLVERLHPTPAVAGVPRDAAVDWIARNEGLHRGWYAGPVGFVDAGGGGEFWLALRSGLIRNPDPDGPVRQTPWARARLFAGAGIVDGSLPEQELRETRIKLRALLAPLTEI